MLITRDELFEKLLRKTEEAGHQLTSSEFKQDPTMPHPNEYAFHYGSFENAAREAYSKVRSKSAKKIAIKKAIKPEQKSVYPTTDHTKHLGRPQN